MSWSGPASDDSRKCSVVNRDVTRLPDSRKATMLRLGCNYAAEHRLGVPPGDYPACSVASLFGSRRLRPLSSPAMPAGDRVRERRKAAALARHYRDDEGLSTAEIARRLGRPRPPSRRTSTTRRMLTKGPRTTPQERQFWALLVMHRRRSASDSSALAATAQGRRSRLPDVPGAEVSSVVIAVPRYRPSFVIAEAAAAGPVGADRTAGT